MTFNLIFKCVILQRTKMNRGFYEYRIENQAVDPKTRQFKYY